MRKIFHMAAMLLFLASCSGDPSFNVLEEDCAGIEIINGQDRILISKDTSWYISSESGDRLHGCDEFKIAAFFNVLRDIQIMGIISRESAQKYDFEINAMSPSGRVIKNLRFSEIPGTAQMVGSADGGKSFVTGVPGLNQNPICNFSASAEYWKDRSLLEISGMNISRISVENFVDSLQSFHIATRGNEYELRGFSGSVLEVSQSTVREWLGAISGTYRAAGYVDVVSLPAADLIYRLKVRSRMGEEDSISFYKKFMPDGKPDFNQMYFKKGADVGTAKYFDFDKLLIDLSKLKG